MIFVGSHEIYCVRCDAHTKPTGRKLTYFETGDLYEYECIDCGQKMWIFGEKPEKEKEKENEKN